MIDDIELQAVQWVRQEMQQGFVRQEVAGLEGTLHQRLGRRSHRVTLAGYLLGDTAADDLKKLQEKARGGEEVTFAADITTALEIEKMVIETFMAEQLAGRAGQFLYRIALAESPTLPPPAEVSSFGGLGEFGLGDLGFDPGALGDVLGDVLDQAGGIMDTLDSALAAVEGLAALANLASIENITNPVRPLTDRVGELSSLQGSVQTLSTALGGLTS
jgi:hypothetical protein